MSEYEIIIVKQHVTLEDKFNNFRNFLWNPYKKEFFGRNGTSWLKICGFYLCFYSALSGLFACLMAIFMSGLDEGKPVYNYLDNAMSRVKMGNTIIGAHPGLGFRPQISPHSTLIRIRSNVKDRQNPLNYLQYVDSVDEYLNWNLWVNQFIPMFGENNPCTKENNFEYDRARPCVLLKLNRIFDWTPQAYLPDDILPQELQEHEKTIRDYPENIFIKCEGEFGVDKDLIGPIDYYSEAPEGPGKSSLGFLPFSYFPYIRQDDYSTPLVFAHFKNLTTSVLINVICKAYARNIYNDKLYLNGAVHFEIFID